MHQPWISAVPGGWWTIAVVVVLLALLPRLLFLLRPRRRVQRPQAWDKFQDADRSQWGKDQWEQ